MSSGLVFIFCFLLSQQISAKPAEKKHSKAASIPEEKDQLIATARQLIKLLELRRKQDKNNAIKHISKWPELPGGPGKDFDVKRSEMANHSSELSGSGSASGQEMDWSASGQEMELSASGQNMEWSASGQNMEWSASGQNMELSASGQNMEWSASGQNMEWSASGQNMEWSASGQETGSALVEDKLSGSGSSGEEIDARNEGYISIDNSTEWSGSGSGSDMDWERSSLEAGNSSEDNVGDSSIAATGPDGNDLMSHLGKDHETDDEGLSADRQKLADNVQTGGGVKHANISLGGNEDENEVEGYIHEMQQQLGEAATDTDLLHAAAEAMAKSGMPAPDFRELHHSKKAGSLRKIPSHKRMTFTSDVNFRWEKNIVIYAFSNSLTRPEIDNVILAQHYIEENSCVTFVEYYEGVHNDLGLNHDTYLEYGNYGGCWSYVGPAMSGAQPISPCAGSGIGTPLHEILHALAGRHEQSRTDRDEWIQILYNNIQDGEASNFEAGSDGTDNRVPYDFGSIMQYSLGSFSYNGKPTINVYDKDLAFLVGKREGSLSFLDREAININHNCKELHCKQFTVHCHNGGFVGYVDGVCQCVCPHGIMGEDCSKIFRPEAAPSSFPSGEYSLPMPASGCPEAFAQGSRYMACAWYNFWEDNIPFVSGSYSYTHMEHFFCSTVGSFSHGYIWPAGRYCIFRKGGSCPSGFTEGFVKFDNSGDGNAQDGPLPDGVYSDNTEMYFCCRSDGTEATSIALPVKDEFILMKHMSAEKCQSVAGTEVKEYYFSFSSGGEDFNDLGQPHPANEYYLDHYDMIFLQYCFYTPKNYDCGGIHLLSDAEPSVTIMSPNYPDSYPANLECFYLFRSPPNTLIKIEFDSFDIEFNSESCVDSLEIRHNLVSQPGERECGEYFPSSKISNYNRTMLVFRSDGAGSNSGFVARLSLIKPEQDFAYNEEDRGKTYGGKVDYTRNYETCLPWDEVGDSCGVSAFNINYIGLGLHNYCRNPNNAEQPWCYTDKDSCETNFCDVSGIQKCYDALSTCEEIVAGKPSYCISDENAFRDCHKTCDFCGQSVTQQVGCDAPPAIPKASQTSESKSSYSAGDSVEFKCDSISVAQTRYCMTDGSWSGTDEMCGACPAGWASVGKSCFKLFAETLVYEEAKTKCDDIHAHLATFASAKEQEALDALNSAGLRYWIGLSDQLEEGTFVWADGTPFGSYEKWSDGQPGTQWYEDCAFVQPDGSWSATYFAFERSYACEMQLGDYCSDSRSDCSDMIDKRSDLCTAESAYAAVNCRKSCNLCP